MLPLHIEITQVALDGWCLTFSMSRRRGEMMSRRQGAVRAAVRGGCSGGGIGRVEERQAAADAKRLLGQPVAAVAIEALTWPGEARRAPPPPGTPGSTYTPSRARH